MTSLPQTHQRTITAQESRRRGPPAVAVPGIPEASGSRAGERPRPGLPAVDPSSAFGCVDWFQYPDQLNGRASAARAR